MPVNILLTEEANIDLRQFTLQTSTPAERISKSDIVRNALQAGLPLFRLVHELAVDLLLTKIPEALMNQSVFQAVRQTAAGLHRRLHGAYERDGDHLNG